MHHRAAPEENTVLGGDQRRQSLTRWPVESSKSRGERLEGRGEVASMSTEKKHQPDDAVKQGTGQATLCLLESEMRAHAHTHSRTDVSHPRVSLASTTTTTTATTALSRWPDSSYVHGMGCCSELDADAVCSMLHRCWPSGSGQVAAWPNVLVTS